MSEGIDHLRHVEGEAASSEFRERLRNRLAEADGSLASPRAHRDPITPLEGEPVLVVDAPAPCIKAHAASSSASRWRVGAVAASLVLLVAIAWWLIPDERDELQTADSVAQLEQALAVPELDPADEIALLNELHFLEPSVDIRARLGRALLDEGGLTVAATDELGSEAARISLSADGRHLALVEATEVIIWEIDSGEVLRHPTTHPFWGWTPDGFFAELPNAALPGESELAFNNRTREVIDPGDANATPEAGRGQLSSDGSTIVFFDRISIHRIDPATNEVIETAGPEEESPAVIRNFTLNEDASTIVAELRVGIDTEQLAVWNTGQDSLETDHPLANLGSSSVELFRFSPTDDVVVVGSESTVRVVDGQTFEDLVSFEVAGELLAVRFSPSGQEVLATTTTGDGAFVRLWDATDGVALTDPVAVTLGPPPSLADGRSEFVAGERYENSGRIAVRTDDGEFTVLDLDTSRWSQLACEAGGLTPDERREIGIVGDGPCG